MGHLQCLDLENGRLLWKYRHPWWPPASAVVCERNRVVIAACNDETLNGIDADSGKRRWSVPTTGLVRGRPLVRAGKVYAATEKGHLHCLDTASGELAWTGRYGRGQWHQFLEGDDTELYVLDAQWHCSALDLQTGALRWIARLRSPGCWAPVRCGRHLVVLSRDGHLAVFDPQEQVKVWEGAIPGTFHQPPAIGEGMLLAASSNAGLLAYDIDPFYED